MNLLIYKFKDLKQENNTLNVLKKILHILCVWFYTLMLNRYFNAKIYKIEL